MTNKEFEERTGLSSNASRETLEKIGGRYLSTEPFELDGKTTRYEQIQLMNLSGGFIWKRISSCGADSLRNFEIHLESTESGTKIYKTSYCKKK
tara:strand:- start:75 stop:356 length:282 start_codon:yes stop_codon:yes gene_type:complete